MMGRIKMLVVRWKVFLIYLAVLVLLSVLPINSASGSSINHIFIVSIRLDYLLHCIIYIPLVAFLWMEKESEFYVKPWKTILWITALLMFAVATEWIQYFLPYRAFNINDLISNCLGIILGLILTFAVKQLIAIKIVSY
jgi:VanZ family protein